MMSEISTENIFHIRKGIIERMGLTQEADDLWFKQLLPAIKLQKLMEEYIKVNPIDESETYYEYDQGAQSGRNEVKEDIISFMKESEK